MSNWAQAFQVHILSILSNFNFKSKVDSKEAHRVIEHTFIHFKQFLMHAALSPPPTLELRQSKVNPGPPSKLGVFAVETLPTGSKFGPFLGKWAFEPGHQDQAWEVGPLEFQVISLPISF